MLQNNDIRNRRLIVHPLLKMALKFYTMFSDSCNPLEKKYIIILKEELQKQIVL